jgi:hypothetical protein
MDAAPRSLCRLVTALAVQDDPPYAGARARVRSRLAGSRAATACLIAPRGHCRRSKATATAEIISTMPNITEGYHDIEPMGADQPEGPWLTMAAAQLRKIADFVADSDASYRIEYRGAGYWNVTRLDAEGEPTDDARMIFAIETG